MAKRERFAIVLLATLICMHPKMLCAKSYSVYLKDGDVSVHASTDSLHKEFYTVQFDVPGIIEGKELYGAFLEFFVDVSVPEKQGYIEKRPVMEIYALAAQFSGSIDTTKFDVSNSGHTVRDIPVGEKRRVLIDVTELIKSYLQNPEKNHGLILGALTGRRDGIFALRDDVLSNGALARLKFHYNNRVKK